MRERKYGFNPIPEIGSRWTAAQRGGRTIVVTEVIRGDARGTRIFYSEEESEYHGSTWFSRFRLKSVFTPCAEAEGAPLAESPNLPTPAPDPHVEASPIPMLPNDPTAPLAPPCTVCGKPTTRRRNSSGKKGWRKTCSDACVLEMHRATMTATNAARTGTHLTPIAKASGLHLSKAQRSVLDAALETPVHDILNPVELCVGKALLGLGLETQGGETLTEFWDAFDELLNKGLIGYVGKVSNSATIVRADRLPPGRIWSLCNAEQYLVTISFGVKATSKLRPLVELGIVRDLPRATSA